MMEEPAPELESEYEGGSEHLPDRLLHRAAAKGDIAEITQLLDAGGDINARDDSESTPLHHAIQANNPEAVRFLLSRGADPSLRYLRGSDGLEGDDAALCAARLNAIAAMQELIAYGVRIHSHALCFAAKGEHMDMIRVLLDDTTGDFSDIPRRKAIEDTLPTAAHTWSIEMVQYLLKNLGFEETAKGTDRQTVLNPAFLAVFDQEDVHDTLVDPDPERDWDSAMQVIRMLVDAGAQVNAQDTVIPRTPLHFALQQRRLPTELVEFLVASGADVNMPDWLGRTQVFCLLIHPDATDGLIESFKKVGGVIDVTDAEGNTPLATVQNPRVARFLLASGANPSTRNNHGEVPLHIASIYGRDQIVSEMLIAGAQVDQRTNLGWTPLMFSSHVEVSKTLLQHGADVHAATDLGWTAIHLNSDCSNLGLVLLLLSYGADVHALATRKRDFWSPDLTRTTVSVSGLTPLHIAVDARGPIQPDVVIALLDHGADIEAKDSTGKTPLLLAIATDGNRAPNEGIVNCLLDRRADTQATDGLGRTAVQLADARGYRINEEGKFGRKPAPHPAYHPRGAYAYAYRGGRGVGRGIVH